MIVVDVPAALVKKRHRADINAQIINILMNAYDAGETIIAIADDQHDFQSVTAFAQHVRKLADSATRRIVRRDFPRDAVMRIHTQVFAPHKCGESVVIDINRVEFGGKKG